MKKVLLVCLCVLSWNLAVSQHVPTLKPTNERLTKVKPAAVTSFEEGNVKFKNGDIAGAKTSYQKATELDQSFAEAYINLSICWEKENNLEKAKEVMTNAINSMIPLNARAFAQRGKIAYKMNDFEAAVYNFNQAISLDNLNNDYHFFSGASSLAMYDSESGQKSLKKAVEIKPSDRNKIGLANAYIMQKKYNDGISTLTSIPNYESSSMACINLAICYHGLEKEEETKKYLDLAKANGGDKQSEFHNLTGLIHSSKGNNDQAMTGFNRAIELENGNHSYYNDRASHLIKIENYKDALVDLNKALEIKPDFGKAYYNRGIVKEMLRDEEGACLDWEYAFFLGYAQAEELLNNPICN